MPQLPPIASFIYRRLLHEVDNYGPRRALFRAVPRLLPRRTAPPPPPPPVSLHPFDVAHRVDTSGFAPGETLRTGSRFDLYNTAYWAISPSTLLQAFAHLPRQVEPARFTFLDLGCGKGRALLLAAAHGFHRVLGVEISPDLGALARANTSSLPQVEVRTLDAASPALIFPSGPLLIFLYHPFLAPVLRRVLANLLAQHAAAPRDLYILFANPTYHRVFRRFPALVEQWDLSFSLSAQDAAADRHGILQERYILYRAT